MTRSALIAALALLSGACGERSEAPPPPAEAQAPAGPAALAPAEPAASPASPALPARLIGEALARAQWASADNRADCAPLALRSDARAGGVARPATFSGGWAVAFDQPGRRSAYGLAGSGLTPGDRADFADLADRLARQWPLVRRWDKGGGLPAGSIAGYGLEGARPYPAGSSGFGQQSLAYLRIPGQACLYNVWSKLGRDHLELLLDQLVLLEPGG